MSDIITLKDGRREWIVKPDDFLYLLEKELGFDAQEYFDNIIEQGETEREEAEDVLICAANDALDEVIVRLKKLPGVGYDDLDQRVSELVQWIEETQKKEFDREVIQFR